MVMVEVDGLVIVVLRRCYHLRLHPGWHVFVTMRHRSILYKVI